MKEFEFLVSQICKKYKFKAVDHVKAVVALRIQHLPPDQGTTTLQHMADCVRKNMSYQLCQHITMSLKHRAELEQLDHMLTENPFNQQALDAIHKAANEGSEEAKKLVAKYTEPSLESLQKTG
jgi:hypothetical protein